MSSSDLTEASLISYIALLGVLTIRLKSNSLIEMFRQFSLALPLGSCYLVAAAIASIAIFSSWQALFIMSAPVVPCLWFFYRNSRVEPGRYVQQGLAVVATCFFLVILLRWWNITILSYDSYAYVGLGGGLVNSAKFSDSSGFFTTYPVFIVVLQGLAQFLGLDYSPSIGPLFVLCGLSYMIFCFLLRLRSRGILTCFLATLLFLGALLSLLSPYFIVHQIFYINNHTAHGCLMFLAVMEICSLSLMSEADVAQKRNFVLIIFTLLGGVAFSRIEGALIASFLLVLLAEARQLTYKQFLAGTVFLIMFQLLWTLLLKKDFNFSTSSVNEFRLFGMMSIPAVICFAYVVPPLRRTAHLWRFAVIIAVMGALYYHGQRSPGHLAQSIAHIVYNLLYYVPWGVFWPVAVLAFGCALYTPRNNRVSAVCYVLSVYIMTLFALTAFRNPYRVGWGDSGNRMLGHLIPFVIYLVTFKVLEVLPTFREKDPGIAG